MGNITNRARAGAVAIAAALLLAACGGGGGDAGTPTGSLSASSAPAAQVLKVDAYEQPASAVQDGVRGKLRAQALPADPVRPTRVALGPLVREKSAPQDSSGGFAPLQIATDRAVGATSTADALQRQLQWRATPQGGLVAAISIDAEGAHGLRLGVLVTQLPGSALLRVYSQFRPSAMQEISGQEVLQLIARNQQAGDTTDAARTWWTPDAGGAEATLEIELPPGTPASALQIAVPRISHVFVDLSLPQEGDVVTKAVNTSSSCELDAVCYSESTSLRNAVARMIYQKDGGGYLCTGTLLNDSGSTGTPYFLTANHCISTQTVASTLQTDWFFRAPSCNSRTLAANTVKRTGGATLLYNTVDTDTSFLRLNDAPPAGAVFAGWDAGARTLNSTAIGVHHPDGDLLKISFGQIFSTADCRSTGGTGIACTGAAGLTGSFYAVRWTRGLTEGGSSGSGLFQGNALVGTLYGGSASTTTCSASTQSVYGRFDQPFQARLKEWLAPAAAPTTPATPASGDRAPIYRFFNSSTGAHFFTSDAGERDFVIRTYPVFQYEGVAFYAYASATAGQSTVFRFFNRATGAHFYTIDQGERDFVSATYPSYQFEGPIWYAQTAAGSGSTPMYRFFNKKTGAHFYTINQAERDFVIATYTDFVYENVAYHAWTAAR